MSVLLFVLGIVGAVAGTAMIGFGIPINEFSLGNTLIVAGTAAIVGGLILLGLSAAVAQLRQITEVLAARPAPRPGRPPDMFEPQAPGNRAGPPPGRVPFPLQPNSTWSGREPQPEEPRFAAAPSIDVAQDGYDRPSPNYASMQRYPNEPPAPAGEPEQMPFALGRQAPLNSPPARAAEVAAVRSRGLNGSGANMAGRGAAQADRALPAAVFDAMWPAEAPHAKAGDAVPRLAPAAAGRNRLEPMRGAPATALRPSNEPRAVAILKSGVVDGMGYTLYVDGSIEAELPQGTLRFASINDLRNHLENNS